MEIRWLGSPRASWEPTNGERAAHSETFESWRTWLMTGIRHEPIDRRRVRGANRGLKKMLIEGTATTGDQPAPWKDFSSAMIRQSVGEALSTLPAEDRQVVKLAYFGGLTNREIADRLGLTVGEVRRRLRDGLATISRYVERGRVAGRRLVWAVVGWLLARDLIDHRPAEVAAAQLMRAGTVAVVAAAVLVAQPAPPPRLSPANPVQLAPAVGTTQSTARSQPAGPGSPATVQFPSAPTSVDMPKVPGVPSLPAGVQLPTIPVVLPVPTPTIPPLPKLP